MVDKDNPSATLQIFDVSRGAVSEDLYGFRMQIQGFCLFDYALILILSSQLDETNQVLEPQPNSKKHKIPAPTPIHRQKSPAERTPEGILKGEQVANKAGWGIGRMAKLCPGHLPSPEQAHKPPETQFRCSLDLLFCCPNQ